MKGTIFAAAALLVVTGLAQVETQSATSAGETVPRAAPQQSTAAASAAQGVVDRYCVTCHNGRMRTGGLALDALKVSDAHGDTQTWEKVVRKVRTGMMPPSGAPRPDRATLDSFAATVEGTIDRAAASAPNPGAPSSIASIAPNTATPYATSSICPSTRRRSSRETIRAKASTTWPACSACHPP